MFRKISVLILVLLSSCHSSSSLKPLYRFYNTHLFFDLDQELENVACTIEGKIPSWISGTLLRNGPAKFTAGKDKRVSWFDGLAMLHAFAFNPENILYSNRFLRSKQYYIMDKEKSISFSGFAQDPCPSLFGHQTSHLIPKQAEKIASASVSIKTYFDTMVALTETPLPVVFDPKTLDTVGNFFYDDSLPTSKMWESAHPQYDPITKETFNYLIEFGRESAYVIWKMQKGSAARQVVAKIPVDLPAYMHSFALTEHYQILVAFPFVVHPVDLRDHKKPFIFNYRWKPERGTTFYVTERSTGRLVAKLKDAPFFAFHHVNAYEKEGKILIDIVSEKNADVIGFVTETLEDKSKLLELEETKLERFTLDLTAQTILKETLFDQPLELPTIAPAKTAQPYRYCYAVDYNLPTTLSDIRPLYKIDVDTKTALSWSNPGCFPGEPIFVPHPNSEREDEGVVLSVILDLVHHTSFLLILDAHDFKEVARAKIPHAIPPGLHGLWKP